MPQYKSGTMPMIIIYTERPMSALRRAWQHTMMPLEDDRTRNKLHFLQYFMGMPIGGYTSWMSYIFLLGFIIYPLTNALKAVTEFPLILLSEFFEDATLNLSFWDPKTNLTRFLQPYLVSTADWMEKLFYVLYIEVRLITSPIFSFYSAYVNGGLKLAILSIMPISTVFFVVVFGIFLLPLPFTILGLAAADLLASTFVIVAFGLFALTALGFIMDRSKRSPGMNSEVIEITNALSLVSESLSLLS